eukprot:10164993-Alexandrium_andersonii.AAC.1
MRTPRGPGERGLPSRRRAGHLGGPPARPCLQAQPPAWLRWYAHQTTQFWHLSTAGSWGAGGSVGTPRAR